MLFNLFGKKENKEAEKDLADITYLSAKAKENAIIKEAKEKQDTIFLAWFNDTAENYRRLFSANQLEETRVTEAKFFSAPKYSGKEIIFLEHFPLREKEVQLVKNCRQQTFRVYNSLTEPFFALFGSEKIITLMQNLGCAEDEPLEHSMISASVKNAQAKLAKKIRAELPASSQKQWLERNTG